MQIHKIFVGGRMKIKLTIKNIRRGYAKKIKDLYKIVIPKWAFNHGEDYWVWYVCHECAHIACHILFKHWRHDENYKLIEDIYLEDFGLKVIRKKMLPEGHFEIRIN